MELKHFIGYTVVYSTQDNIKHVIFICRPKKHKYLLHRVELLIFLDI